ncbi:MAG: hypothetical protein J2P20_07600 [Pseudonocardia sp.]|nr:hypothetical protein [Pseudonocardia sp.]
MDSVSLIVDALAAGAVAGAQGTATQAVKDAYGGLKSLVTRRFGTGRRLGRRWSGRRTSASRCTPSWSPWTRARTPSCSRPHAGCWS